MVRVLKINDTISPIYQPILKAGNEPLPSGDIDAIRTFWQTTSEQFYIPNYL